MLVPQSQTNTPTRGSLQVALGCRCRFSGRDGALGLCRSLLSLILTHLFVTAFMPAAVDCTTDSEISMGPVAPPHR